MKSDATQEPEMSICTESSFFLSGERSIQTLYLTKSHNT